MTWKQYAIALVVSNVVMMTLWLILVLRIQGVTFFKS